MATQDKIEIVNKYTEKFKNASSVYLADFTGIDVATISDVRRKFRAAGVEYKVLKNRLARISLNNAGINDLDNYLKGVSSFIICYDDPAAPARVFKELNKKKEVLKVKVVYFEGGIVPGEKALALADLPTREQLLGHLLRTLQAPMTKLAATLQGGVQKLVYGLVALKDSK